MNSCFDYMSLLSTCLSARMQLINVRKYGQYETCGRYVNEFTTCLLLASKVRSGAITQEQMDIEEGSFETNRKYKVCNDVLVIKETPGWTK